MTHVRRVSVVGPSGSGKTTLGLALAVQLGVPFVERDSIYHQVGSMPLDADVFRDRVDRLAAGHRRVVDGNGGDVVRSGPVRERAVIWLVLPLVLVMRHIIGRTVGRVIRRKTLWNGNRGRLSHVVRWDPEESIIRWTWTTHRAVHDRHAALVDDEQFAHLDRARLRSRSEIDARVADGLPAVTPPSATSSHADG